ncbi:GntR family transcriptional regulator [Oscillatoria sp. CS-180]|uniref:GntR family transcriptional regulator n=1 Tax=Oscillatoria sp. CS-180 TaxID=3021720 RepID=UPI0023301AB2|nr:GntR family transcriptional regulator [Oscillatoria sp. CS-180]MDB9529370.1 GntR family transcriptional regulator [Oscillatoria sp. CS-180]
MTFSMVPSSQGIDKQHLHITISEKLKQKIETGEYEPGERLPSEFDLGQVFGVSRTTIRKAIGNLIQQGLVTTQQGKGIFVTEQHKISFSMANPLMYFDSALKQQGYVGQVQSLRFQRIKATSDVSRKLQLPAKDTEVYWQEKIIYADDSPIALDVTYYPVAIGESLAEKLQQGFTYSTLVKNGIHLNAAEVSLESIPASYELSEYLAIPLGMPLLVFNYLVYHQQHQPAVCGKTLSRSDWTCYTAEIEVDQPDFSTLVDPL